MIAQNRFNIIDQDNVNAEVARLRSLPPIDRKLEMVCTLPAIIVEGVHWSFVDVINEPEGFGGRFAAALTEQSGNGWYLEATKIGERWLWEIYHQGTRLEASGEAQELYPAVQTCSLEAKRLRATAVGATSGSSLH